MISAAQMMHRERAAPPTHRGARPGASLPAALRRDLEPAFGNDFAGVRVHTDAEAARKARRIGAGAFTVGRDIWSAPGAHAPATPEGHRLLAHELTHVVQQGAVASGRPADPVRTHPRAVRRQVDPDTQQPTDQPVALQSGSGPGFTIHIDRAAAQPCDASGSASSRGLFPFSAMGRLEHFCSRPADCPLRIRFYIDAAAILRPRPFQPLVLSVIADFAPSGRSPWRIDNLVDPRSGYRGAGWRLGPAFGDLPFGDLLAPSSSQSGALAVRVPTSDPDTGRTSSTSTASPVCWCPALERR
jgi:hypothetical protein